MAKELDNTLIRFSRGASRFAVILFAALVMIGLGVGLIIAISILSWPFIAIFSFSLISLLASIYLNINRTRHLFAFKNEPLIDWQTSIPEIQKQDLNIEVAALSKILDTRAEQIPDLQSAFIVAEDLAFRQIQQEEDVPLLRHVSIGKVPFGAVFLKQDVMVCAEVSFLVAPELRQERIDAMMLKIGAVKKVFEKMKIGIKVRLMIIIVTQLDYDDNERLRGSLGVKRFSTTPVDIDIRLLDFEALQRIYITS